MQYIFICSSLLIYILLKRIISRSTKSKPKDSFPTETQAIKIRNIPVETANYLGSDEDEWEVRPVAHKESQKLDVSTIENINLEDAIPHTSSIPIIKDEVVMEPEKISQRRELEPEKILQQQKSNLQHEPEYSNEISGNIDDLLTNEVVSGIVIEPDDVVVDNEREEKSENAFLFETTGDWTKSLSENKWLEQNVDEVVNITRKKTDSLDKQEKNIHTTGRFHHKKNKRVDLEEIFEKDENNKEDIDELGIDNLLSGIDNLVEKNNSYREKKSYSEDDMLNEFSHKMRNKIPSSSFHSKPKKSNSFTKAKSFATPPVKKIVFQDLKDRIDRVVKDLPSNEEFESLKELPQKPPTQVEKPWLSDKKKNYGQSNIIGQWRKQLGLQNFDDM